MKSMANHFLYQDKIIPVGSTIGVTYRFKEGEKERKQVFKGTLIKVRGNTPATRMITVRKISKSGIGVERIIPLTSPFLEKITVLKKSSSRKAKLYFIRELSKRQLRTKIK